MFNRTFGFEKRIQKFHAIQKHFKSSDIFPIKTVGKSEIEREINNINPK